MKKKTLKKKFRNSSGAAALPRARPAARRGEDDSKLKRLGYVAAGAAASAVVGSFLAKELSPKTVASVIAVAGGVAAGASDVPLVQQLGMGAMSAGGGQLALLLIDDRAAAAKDDNKADHKKRQADGLPPGALENAFERARARMAAMGDDAHRFTD